MQEITKKIEFNLGYSFVSLDSRKNIESIIQLLMANKLYDKAITSDLPSNKRAVNLAYVGFLLGIGRAATN